MKGIESMTWFQILDASVCASFCTNALGNPSVLPLALDSLTLARQPVNEKENSECKPAVLN